MNPKVAKLALYCAVCCGAWLALAAQGAEPAKQIHYVQLIRGDDEDRPPTADSKVVGPKLGAKLRPLFRWKSYWEIQRQRVELSQGEKARLRLSKDREVEIDLTETGKRSVTISQSGRRLSRSIRKSGESMTIIGGERDAHSVWFVVVRVDQPSR